MGLPPSFVGGVKLTVAVVSPAVADTPVGGSGAVAGACGVMGFEGVEGVLVPMLFVAVAGEGEGGAVGGAGVGVWGFVLVLVGAGVPAASVGGAGGVVVES